MGQVKSPAGERLSDRIAIGVLTRAFPPGLVDEVIAETGRGEKRSRLLPARVVVYFVLAMCLFFGQGYEEVARVLGEGLGDGRRSWRVPTTAAIGRARRRLGPEPLRLLFARVCRPMAVPGTAGAWYRRWRLVAVDGTTLDLADTEANDAFFGRHVSGRGASAFPQARVVGLAECGTHAVFAAVTGPLSASEQSLSRQLFDRLREGMLLLADRGFYGFELWQHARATGADLLWRVRKSANLPVVRVLSDGSYLSTVHAEPDRRSRRNPVTVRVVEYTLASTGDGTVYRLITTLLDPEEAPAAELAALYVQRWEIETTLDEIKTHQRGPKLVLRSKYPWGVEQEVYGLLLVHHAIRQLMHQAALHEGVDPDRLSFTRSLRVVRRQVPAQAALSPRQTHQGAEPHPG
ncbi:Transposase DDE domain-containing protein [Streptomyces sp. 1331.2]|nr:transposase, IS4 family [Streptomyces sp. 1331.2]SOB83808.1 Transposase DDE domain-containing protein [Streptomyces sp. 1331.2]SOB83921.1 Transposase DDE domain-containing protein [Streptomyces sp. 1331.2]SOB84177.1 Transposase DDE domain-containing protein [Streptomyces sp. 1331.2]SOB84310.1 Transposase DDE domain-containing protein [Streptomyces sp. 1331.2]